MKLALSCVNPNFFKILGKSSVNASFVGYLEWVSESKYSCEISLLFLKPLYHISKGCNLRPNFLEISFATVSTCGEERYAVNNLSTSRCEISRSSLKVRDKKVELST